MPTLRLELVTVVPAVLSSIAERHLGDTLLLALTAEEEVSTVLLSALTPSSSPHWWPGSSKDKPGSPAE